MPASPRRRRRSFASSRRAVPRTSSPKRASPRRRPEMARNTQVQADTQAPPVTQILAKFVSGHPSRGWNDAVEHEALRTFLNWVGCAVGASRHESAEAALGAMKMLEPSSQASVLGRAEKLDMAGAALVNGITSH